MSNSVTFTVIGLPAPQGSKVRTRYAMRESSPNVEPWRVDVKNFAIRAKPAEWDMEAAMSLSVVFRFRRPKSHLTQSGLSSNAPLHCTSARKGDLDKLLRSTNDALTEVLFNDDRQVTSIIASKRYCEPDEPQGAIITLTTFSTQ